jgi:hypothetical protein
MILWARHRVIANKPADAVPQALEAMKSVRKYFLPSSMSYWFGISNTAFILNSAKRNVCRSRSESLAGDRWAARRVSVGTWQGAPWPEKRSRSGPAIEEISRDL